MALDRQHAPPVVLVGGGFSFPNAASITPNDVTILAPAPAALWVNVTVAGNLAVVMLNGQTVTIPLPTGIQTLPFAVSQVKVTGTTATLTILGLW